MSKEKKTKGNAPEVGSQLDQAGLAELKAAVSDDTFAVVMSLREHGEVKGGVE